MKLKKLKKKIQQLEKRLREGTQKLAKLKQKLQAGEATKAMKAARKSAARATAQRPISKLSPSTGAEKRSSAKKAKRELHLSPEGLARLAAAVKARMAAQTASDARR